MYKWLHIFGFPEGKFALGILHSSKGNICKQTQRKMKEGSITEHISMETEVLKELLKLAISKYFWREFITKIDF